MLTPRVSVRRNPNEAYECKDAARAELSMFMKRTPLKTRKHRQHIEAPSERHLGALPSFDSAGPACGRSPLPIIALARQELDTLVWEGNGRSPGSLSLASP